MDHADDIESAVNERNKPETIKTQMTKNHEILTDDIEESKNTLNENKSADKNKNLNKNLHKIVRKKTFIKDIFQFNKNDLSSDNAYAQPISPEQLSFSSLYPNGALVLEVIDEGVGMAPDDYKKLFKSVVQFNPNELQVIFFYLKNI